MGVKKRKEQVGDLIKIPYKPSWHVYARFLPDGSYAFYDTPSNEERSDYDSIIQSDVLFVAHVDIFGVKEKKWTIIANIPFTDKDPLNGYYPRYFNPNPAAPENFGFYEVYKQEIEDAIKKDWIKTGRIQLHGIYGRLHIEERVNDYYDGKRYPGNAITIKFFKSYPRTQVE